MGEQFALMIQSCIKLIAEPRCYDFIVLAIRVHLSNVARGAITPL